MTNSILHLGLMEDGDIELDLAALELAALDHPGVDLDEYIDELTDIEIALRAADGDAVSSVAQAQALSSVMVEEFGFSGDRVHYDDPQNADLVLMRSNPLRIAGASHYRALSSLQGDRVPADHRSNLCIRHCRDCAARHSPAAAR